MKYISYNAIIIFFLACIVTGVVFATVLIMFGGVDTDVVCAPVFEWHDSCTCICQYDYNTWQMIHANQKESVV